MQTSARTNRILAVSFILAALLIVFVWVPLDTDSGLVEKVRSRVIVGDALAPTLAAAVIGMGGLMVLFQQPEPYPVFVSAANIRFLLVLLLVFALSFALMRWSGPALVALSNLLTGGEGTYRALRDTAPWKHVGFVAGNTFLVFGMIAAVEGRVTRRSVLIAILASLGLIALYDLPFDNLLLPPNGDV